MHSSHLYADMCSCHLTESRGDACRARGTKNELFV